jgi:hypothetical protein
MEEIYNDFITWITEDTDELEIRNMFHKRYKNFIFEEYNPVFIVKHRLKQFLNKLVNKNPSDTNNYIDEMYIKHFITPEIREEYEKRKKADFNSFLAIIQKKVNPDQGEQLPEQKKEENMLFNWVCNAFSCRKNYKKEGKKLRHRVKKSSRKIKLNKLQKSSRKIKLNKTY